MKPLVKKGDMGLLTVILLLLMATVYVIIYFPQNNDTCLIRKVKPVQLKNDKLYLQVKVQLLDESKSPPDIYYCYDKHHSDIKLFDDLTQLNKYRRTYSLYDNQEVNCRTDNHVLKICWS